MIAQDTPKSAPVDDPETVLAELVEQFIDRLHDGERVAPLAFAAEHPGHLEDLMALLPAAETMARLRRPVPETIGGYRVVREVGRGGMGVVLEAEQLATGQKVALKVLPIGSATDPRRVERFRIEGQAAASLDHPHIVPILEVGCERGVHFHAMRFIEGRSLAEVVAEARSGAPGQGPREAARLACQAAEALAHAHDLGIIHRDVKPANLLLDPARNLWVADFGLARFLDGGDLTRTGDVVGTLRYLSPEQARGRGKVGPSTDVYSLGATLYELVTLRPAFDGQDRQDLLRRIVEEEPVAARQVDPAIPRELETILASAMAKEARDRYGSAQEFADDLRRFFEGRPILARRPDAATRAARWARRNRAAVAVASTVLVVYLLGTGLAAALLWREQVRTRENLRVALTALDEFCLSTTSLEPTRDPEQAQDVQDLQLKSLTIYERMLRQNPGDPEARWVAARAEHRVANLLARTPRFAEAEPAFRAAHQNLTRLLGEDPHRLDYRREEADLLADWGASQLAGNDEVKQLRRRALDAHLRLASETPGDPRDARAVARDGIEVARTIGITIPAELVEKEALFRRAVALREGLKDRSFEGKAELAEALAYLGHLLNATARRGEGGEVMARGNALLADLQSASPGDSTRRQRVVMVEDLFRMPRYCEPSPDPDRTLAIHLTSLEARARLSAEFPYLPDFRASLAWAHHGFSTTLGTFGRGAEAEAHERRAVAIFEELLRQHPSVDHYRRWGALAVEALGEILEKSNRPEEARAQFRRALAIVPETHRMRARLALKLRAAAPTLGDRPASQSR